MKIELMDRIIAFHACFVKPLGSVNAALMFSQMIYWSNRTDNNDGWFYKTADEFEEETGLSRKEQANARAAIMCVGWVEERLCGIPATLNFRLTNQFYLYVQTSFAQSGKLDLPKAENLLSPKVKTNSESTTKSTTKIKKISKTDFDFPDSLANMEGFVDLFLAYVQNKRELKIPATVLAQNLILKTLSERPQEAVRMIELAISKSWQGVRWDWYDKECPRGDLFQNRTPVKPSSLSAEEFSELTRCRKRVSEIDKKSESGTAAETDLSIRDGMRARIVELEAKSNS